MIPSCFLHIRSSYFGIRRAHLDLLGSARLSTHTPTTVLKATWYEATAIGARRKFTEFIEENI